MRKVDKREAWFIKRFGDRNKQFSHQIIQRRKDEYADVEKLEKKCAEEDNDSRRPVGMGRDLKTPYQMIEEIFDKFTNSKDYITECGNMAIEAKRKMHKPVTTVEITKKKEKIVTINYIGKYLDERGNMTGTEMVETLGEMMS